MKILQRIISALNPTEEGTEPVDLADAAWLAAHLWRFSPGEDSVPADAKTEIESAEHRQPPDSDRETEDLRDQEQVPDAPLPETGPSENFFPEDRISSRPSYEDRSFEIHLPRGSEQDGKLRFICPAPPALTDTDKLAMALRPLKQIVLSHAHYVIDEDATVESIAEEGFWEPVLRFKPERRFDIALVVEKSLSMIFWHNVVTELKQLLIRQGIFRDVRVWSLIKDVRDESGLGIVPGLNQKTGRRSPSAITDITGRRLILVVSDCVSESWYEGRMAQQISKWSRYGSVALLQVLPEQMWERTGLGSAIPIRITSQSVGGHHSPYNAETLFGLSEDILNDGAMLPIATIEPEPVKRLVEMIASAGDQSAPGFCLASNLTADGKRKSSKTQTSEEQLDEFLDTASPNSYQLAVMLAAAPRIRLPIIRLIRASMLRDASHTHELEFLLSGLVKVIGNGADRSAYPDEIDFDFIPGVREELLDHLSVAKARQVLEAVSVYVEEHLGEARGFASVIADPSQGDLRRVDELGEAFARVAASVLGRLGGRYDGLLDQLKYKETFSQTINQMLASAMEKARSLESDYLQNRSNLGYLNKAIEEWESILNHPDFDDVGQDLQFRVLYDSAGTYFLRYEKTHSLKYLDFALLCLRKSLENIHSDSSKVPLVLESLAIGLRSRYSQTGELRELEDSIDTFGQAVSLTSENSSGLPKLLNNLGSALTDRYFSSNNLNDLENAIDAFKKAEKLSPENSSEFYDILSNLGNGLINRYNLSGDLKDLENALATFEKILSSMPEDSPDLPARLSNLGNGLISRYMRTGDFKDLGNAITAFEKAISFTPEGSPDLPDRLNSLGNGLINRYYQTGELNDLENAIATLERAISLIPENSSELPSVLNNLGIGLTDRYNRTGNLKDLESAVEAFEKSVNLTPENSPDLPRFLSYFGNGLKDRYARTGELKDLENAIQDFEQSARLSPEDSPDLPHLLNNLGSGLRDRYARTSDLSDLEAAIAAFEKSVALTPDNSLDLPRMLADLGNGLRDSYARTGAFSDLEAAIAAFEKSVSLAPENSPGLPRMLANLGNGLRDRYARTGALGDLEAAIAAFEKSVSLTPENYSPGLPRMLADLGNGLRDRYARTGALSDLGAAIAAFEKSLSLTPENSPGLPRMLADLGNGLRDRYVRSGDWWDLEAGIEAYEKATKRGLEVAVEEALRISCNWLRWAFERREWKEAKQAYTYTYQAGERLFRIQLLREQKESFLKETQGLAALGAYSLAKLNRMPEAVLASDSGQARLLSEALALDRAYLSNLEGTNHASLVTDYRESVALHQELIRRLGEVAPDDKEQQNVLYAELKQARMKMDETIETIRQISGYEDFLSAPEFEEIQDAARDHPLVYIMSTTAGGLSIIVKDDVTPVWLPELTENKLNEILIGSETEKLSATKLEKILKGSEKEESLGGYLGTYLNWRNANTSSTRESAEDTWFKTLEHTTKWLWQAVMEPLTKAFPSDSRVTLIPVGHLNLLPLHAAWTEDHTKPTGKRYALDTIIISYSPNARYLISAQNIANSISSETLLVVDDPSPVKANRLPNSTYEVEAAASLFPEEKRRILRHEEATRHAVLEAINDYTVLHFSCHGSADFNNPLNSCLLMANDERFTIKDLLGLRLKGSRLAVLSASETSIIGLDLPDEVVSLSAGMLQAGAAGVVASLWSPYDLSTAFLMMYFYDIWRKKEIEPVEALRQAQIWMRDTTSREKAIYLKEESNKKEIYRKVRLRRDDHFEHPCHWAVFGYMGV